MATIALETQLSRKSRGDSYARTECQGHEGALNLNMEEFEGHQSIDTKFGQGEVANELDRGSEFRSKSEKGAFNPDTTPSDVMNPAHNVANGKSLNDGESILDAVLPTTTNNGDIIHGRSCRNSSSDAWRDPDDSQNPLNWSKQTKWINVLLISSQTMLSSICSTILAVGSLLIIADFHLDSIYTPNLGVAMYILGLGPLWLGPLSEIYGRRVVYLGSFSLFVLFNVGCALAPNLAALAVLRLLAGTCGSAGPTLGGASIGDMFLRKDRGRAQALYSLGPTAGPVLGPLIGAYVVNGTKDWRRLMWLMVIAPAVTVLLSFLFLKETYAPYLLRQKAKKELEADTNDLDLRPGPLFSRSMLRPFQMLIFAPICSVMSLYMSIVYGILYLHLTTIPLLFGPEEVYGLYSYRWQHGNTGLAYLGAGLGAAIGTFVCAKYLNRSYAYMAKRHLKKSGSDEPLPESRMLFLQLGMLIVPCGLIIFGWSAERQVHWAVTLLGAMIFAIGMLMAYVCVQTYLVDVYEMYAASALAANIFARSTTACLFSIVGFQLYRRLGYAWGTMLIAFMCIAMIPAPLVLYKFGGRLRRIIPKEPN